MLEKEGVQMVYGEGTAGPHAVTSVGSGFGAGGSGLVLTYDANGNMLSKTPSPEPGALSDLTAQLFSYDAESRLIEVKTAQEETVTVTFQPGWNFFSLPVIPEDGAVVVLLPSFAQDFEKFRGQDT